ncbi:MAG TPA: Verru_Chthon cassette protein C [Terrimicrobiaceae bacterium]|nr:Verru_Chthon cassette protein C [Terrimicrobiaceae bacterium]
MSGFVHPLRKIRRLRSAGFSLLEMLTAFAVFTLMLVMLFSVISHTSDVWRGAKSRIESFQTARNAFETVTRNLSQATLNTYWRYDNPSNPTRYLRTSDLHFVVDRAGTALPGKANTGQAVFFQAPSGVTATNSLRGLDSLLTGLGYYVDFCSDKGYRPQNLTTPETHRYRLMQLRIPAESLTVHASTNATDYTWITSQTNRCTFPVADNIILLAVWPRLAEQEDASGSGLTSDFSYNSRRNALNQPQPRTAAQLPPIIEVAMVAVDESSARKTANEATPPGAIEDALAGKFLTSDRQTYEQDLKDLEAALTAAHVKYRIFRSSVPLRESKWSE